MLSDAITTFENNDVPEKYWKEQLKHAFFKEVKEFDTIAEKRDHLRNVIHECSARYIDEKLNR